MEVAYEEFEAQAYLKRCYSDGTYPNTVFCLPHLYSLYKSLGKTNRSLQVLDVGAGPSTSIAQAISAAPYASEIVLSDYVEDNCKAGIAAVDG